MKLLLAFLPLALAANHCTPGTYRCETSPTQGWAVCTTQGEWVRGGSCRAGEYCSFNPINGSPYCLPAPPRSEECSPDLFRCEKGDKGWSIDVCEGGRWAERVRCGEGKVCVYGAVNGYPYCTATPPY